MTRQKEEASVENVFVSWSGGKDCCLALHRAVAKGLKVCCLLNMVSEDGQQSRSHGLAAKWLQMQAQAMGIRLVQRPTTDAGYETEFTSTLLALKQEGITAGVFGDIDFNAHREWIERVCASAGMVPHLPLWLEDQTDLLQEFIASGFQAVVVATKADLLGEEWLGRTVDAGFLNDLSKLPNITPCGEAGEYHTLVTDGPLFKSRVRITETRKVQWGDHWFLDIVGSDLQPRADES